MKLRQRPEDFRVEELLDLPLSEKGGYRIYRVEKRSVSAVDLLETLAAHSGIERKLLGYAGLKDRHALTVQHVSVPQQHELRSRSPDISLSFLGYSDRALCLGSHAGNRFSITARDLSPEDAAQAERRGLSASIPNYFDSQRFGSLTDGFIAEALIRKDYERAMRLFFAEQPSDAPGVRREKREILANWNRLATLRLQGKNGYLVRVYLKTESWLQAYKRISPELRQLFVSAYQSYLWNECVKELLSPVPGLFEVPYRAGTLFFIEGTPELPESFPTVSHKLVPQPHEEPIVHKILEREHLALADFDIRKTGNFFKTHERRVLLSARLRLSVAVDDELNPGRLAMTVSFTLPPGSYATIVLKHLFS